MAQNNQISGCDPLFFPFTHVSGSDLEMIASFFPGIYALCPASAPPGGDKDLNTDPVQSEIIPCYLSEDMARRLDRAVKQFLQWADTHKGNEKNLKLLLKEQPYFTSDSHVPAITSRLKQMNEGVIQKDTRRDWTEAVFNDLLFLKLAHRFDAQCDGIDDGLACIEKQKKTLLADLKGMTSADDSKKGAGTHSDNRVTMISERVDAWFVCARAMKLVDGQAADKLFVTTSKGVWDYLESNCGESVNLLDFDKVKVHENSCKLKGTWQHQLTDTLSTVLQKGAGSAVKLPDINDGCNLRAVLKVSRFSGGGISNILNSTEAKISVCLIQNKR